MPTRSFGQYVRRQRLALLQGDKNYSLRRVALASRLEPSFLSKIERGLVPPPSEGKIRALAETLREDPDVLLAMAGKVSTDVQDAIRRRPRLFTELIRRLKHAPDTHLDGMVREARAKYGQSE